MKSFLQGVAVQVTSIILAALGAAAIAFISSIAGQAGLECTPVSDPQQVGFLGAFIKSIHSALSLNKNIS